MATPEELQAMILRCRELRNSELLALPKEYDPVLSISKLDPIYNGQGQNPALSCFNWIGVTDENSTKAQNEVPAKTVEIMKLIGEEQPSSEKSSANKDEWKPSHEDHSGIQQSPSSTDTVVQQKQIANYSFQERQVHSDREIEDNELDEIWQDAFLATAGPWDTNKTQDNETDGCNHRFILKDSIGKVCEECGLVGQLISNIFDLKRPIRKRPGPATAKLTNKKQRREDGRTSFLQELPEDAEEVEEVVKLTPHPYHEKRMHGHQKEGFRFLCKNLLAKNPTGVILAHAPGTGKTFLVVSFLQSYFAKYPTDKAVIVAPKSMLQPWAREFKKWEVEQIPIYSLAETAVSGDASRVSVTRKWFTGNGVLLITHQLLGILIGNGQDAGDALGCKRDLETENAKIEKEQIREMLLDGANVLVLDEAHYARTDNTRIFSSLKEIRTHRRVLLSGTVFQNSFDELFNVLKLGRPTFLSGEPEYMQVLEERGCYSLRDPEKHEKQLFKEEFEEKILNRDGKYSVEEQNCAIIKLRRLTEPFLHWYAGQVLEALPGLAEFVVVLNLSEAQKKIVSNQKSGKSCFITRDHKLALAFIHPCLVVEDGLQQQEHLLFKEEPLDGVKTTFVFELLHYCRLFKERAIIFSQFLSTLNLLEAMLISKWGWNRGSGILYLDGKTAQDERERVISDFNSEKSGAHVLLASIKACGEGISLVGGSRVVILDTEWNPSVVRQAVSRAFRIGQTRKVYVYRLLANESGEVEKYSKSMEKHTLAKGLLDKNFSSQELVRIMASPDLLNSPLDGSSDDKFLDDFMDNKRPQDVQAVYTPRL